MYMCTHIYVGDVKTAVDACVLLNQVRRVRNQYVAVFRTKINTVLEFT